MPSFSQSAGVLASRGWKEGNLFQFPPLSLSFFASSDSELLVIHPCMQKVCLCSVCPFPISHEKSNSCLTARGRERGGGQSPLPPSLFEIFKSAADQTIPFANVHLVKWDGLGMALSSKFQPNPSFMMFEAGTLSHSHVSPVGISPTSLFPSSFPPSTSGLWPSFGQSKPIFSLSQSDCKHSETVFVPFSAPLICERQTQ